MDDVSALAAEHLALAKKDPHGISAYLFLHDGPLRQSVIALSSGSSLEEHNTPPAASIYVLQGRVRLTEGTADQEIGSGQIQRVPQLRHGVLALEDSVFLLTAVTGIGTE
ncbi:MULTISPECIES: cupin [unclassified Streptomyces]|uniref:cupin n=1 Tax=unclassified Streptomyces TaxID=2593676 RepID=UPI002DD834EA|nr:MULTISPECIES: cupin [unclassified Streptomyces]WSA94877.1 cupin [Streptomyces sp. NBC_01795]WSS12499.1 cupin [Streptomyces sp. NBC_01186]WSS41285.1 cupin [Streptomyces sp. NBC_01187]